MNLVEKENQFNSRIDKISYRILEQMKQGAANWEMPWKNGIEPAINQFTGNLYNGQNTMVLLDECLEKNYSVNRWATLNQWNRKKASVKRGEKSTLVKFVIPKKHLKKELEKGLEYEDDDVNHEYSKRKGFIVRYYNVFNADQVLHFDPKQPSLFDVPISNYDRIDRLIIDCKIDLRHSNVSRAYYSIINDFIHLPFKAFFRNINEYTETDHYYSTLLHEIIHWTSHSSRCDRDILYNQFGDSKYAFEELVAELGNALLISIFKQRMIPQIDHARYLNSWIRVLENDFSYFFDALNLAIYSLKWLSNQSDILGFKPKIKSELKMDEDKILMLPNIDVVQN